ncbi:MAG TPA: reverse transcriptase-like protein [Anaerolineales bacterium]|nr:reverse transcriptase-like protein [Anaerolineales bacterium]
MNKTAIKTPAKLQIYTDGAIRPERGISGLAAIVRDETGKIYHWWSKRAGPLTCNEAEYAAAIYALEQALRRQELRHAPEIEIVSDSRVLVDQMSGRAAARAPALCQARSRLQALVARFHKVSFRHIAREQNRLADALAFDAVSGSITSKPRPASECPHPETWDQLTQLWRKP